MLFAWIKVTHLLGMVLWTGSLLVLTRVLVWHHGQEAPVGAQLESLERKLLFGGSLPGMLLSLASGFWMLYELGWGPLNAKLFGAGFHIKLTFVALLIVMHFVVMAHMQSLQYPDEKPPRGRLAALHGIVATLLIAILVSVLVVYPTMAKRALEKATAASHDAPSSAE